MIFDKIIAIFKIEAHVFFPCFVKELEIKIGLITQKINFWYLS